MAKRTAKAKGKRKSKPDFSFLPHTADMRMMVQGKSMPELFKNAAMGLSDYLDISAEKTQRFSESIRIEAKDTESLFVGWLNELVYLSDREKINFDQIEISKLTKSLIVARVKGRKLQEGYHPTHEIKAFTYHNLKVKKTKHGYKTEILFDI